MLNFTVPKLKPDGTVLKSSLGHTVYESFGTVYARLLPLISGQMTTIEPDGTIVSRFDKILDILKKEASYDISMQYLVDVLQKLDDYKKEQFTQAFALKNESFRESEITIEGDTYKYVNRSSIVVSAADKFESLMHEGFKNNFIQSEIVNGVNSFTYKKQPPFFEHLKAGESFENLKNRAVTHLIELGFNHPRELVEKALLKHVKNSQGELVSFVKILALANETLQASYKANNLTTKEGNLIHPIKGDIKTKVKGEKIFKEFATTYASMQPEYNDHTVVGAKGKSYSYTPQSHLWSFVDMYKNKDRVMYTNASQPLYDKLSFYDEYLNTPPSSLLKLMVSRFNRIKLKDDNGVDNNSTTLLDSVFDSIHRSLLNDIPNMMANADKSSMLFLEGTRKFNLSIENGKIKSTTIAIKHLYNLFEGEVQRVNAVKKFKEENPLVDGKVPKDWVLYFHYNLDKNGNVTPGNGEKLVIFEFLLPALIEAKLYNPETGEYSLQEAHKNTILEIIADYYQSKFDEAKAALEEMGMMREDGTMRMSDELKAKLPKLPDGLSKEEITERNIENQSELLMEWYISNYINNIETSIFFNGDAAYYKNKVDFLKRIPAAYIDGLTIDVKNENEINYNAAVINKIETPSTIQYSDEQMKQIAEATGETLADVEKQFGKTGTYTKDYANNIADAQAWGSINRWEFLMRKTYGIAPSVQEIIDDIKAGKKLTATQTANLLKVMSAQPVKGVHFQVIDGVPRYLKYSLMPLIPSMIKGSQLEIIAKQMETDNIDELVTLDGIKVGAEGISTIHEGENLIQGLTGNKKGVLNPIVMDNRHWRLQQQLSSKQIKDGDLGSQIQKNIFANLDFTKPENIKKALNVLTAISDLMQAQSQNFAEELGALDKNGIVDWSKANKDKLVDILSKQVTEPHLVEALRKGVEISALPMLREKLQAVLSAKLKKAFVKVGINQSQMIQVSNFGTNKLASDVKTGIYWLQDESTLSMPKFETRDDGTNVVIPGQILLPHHVIAKYIPNYAELTPDEFRKRVDKRLLNLIGYRIPNQGMSSIDALEVVGILPPEAGDSVVVYTGLTTKTGSDFDIDKMFMFLPDYEVKSNTVNTFKSKLLKKTKKELVDYYFNEVSKGDNISETFEKLVEGYDKNSLASLIVEELLAGSSEFAEAVRKDTTAELKYVESNGSSLSAKRNKLYESYWNIIIAPSNYMELTASIDEPTDKIKESLADPNFESKDVFDPLFQLIYKSNLKLGKAGLGFVANHLVTHKMSQLFELFYENMMSTINGQIGFEDSNYAFLGNIKNKEGYKIDQILSGYMNLFVDIAKDPKIAESNYTLTNMSTAMALIRMGVPDTFVSKFFQSKALKLYSRFESQRSSMVVNSFEIDVESKIAESLYGKDAEIPDLATLFQDAEARQYLKEIPKGEFVIYEFKPSIEMFESENPNVQAIVYQMFIHLRGTIAKDVSSVNKATKIDTDGYGRYESNKVVFLNKIHDALMSSIGNVDKLFNANHDKHPSFVGRKAFNELFSATEVNSRLFNDMSKEQLAFISVVQQALGVNPSNEVDSLEWVAKSIYKNIIARSPLYKVDNVEKLFETKPSETGQKSLIERVINARNFLSQRGYSNFFLDSITSYNAGKYTFLEINSSLSKNPEMLANLSRDWGQLINNEWVDFIEISEKQQENLKKALYNLALDIARHQFYATGFSGGINSFYDAIPVELITANSVYGDKSSPSHNEYMSTAYTHYNTQLLDIIAKNNVKELQPVSKKKSDEFLDLFFKELKGYDVIKNSLKKQVLLSDKHTRFLKIKNKSTDSFNLLKAVGRVTIKGVGTRTVYALDSTLSYKDKRRSILEPNNDTGISQIMANNMIASSPDGFNLTYTNIQEKQKDAVRTLRSLEASLQSNELYKAVVYSEEDLSIFPQMRIELIKAELIQQVLMGGMTQFEYKKAFLGEKAKPFMANKKAILTKEETVALTPEESKQVNTVSEEQTNNETNLEFAKKAYQKVLNNFGKNVIGKKASDFNSDLNDTVITESNYKQFLEQKLNFNAAFDGSNNYKENFEYWLTEENIDTAKGNGDTELGIKIMKQFFTELVNEFSTNTINQTNELDVNQPTKETKINIYAGTNENSELSNFAIRPFTTNVETPSGEKTYTFQSVEQGFHFYKALVANNAVVAKQILATTNGGQLKKLTNRSNLPMTSEQIKEWDSTSKSIMLNLMYDSYTQNPNAVQKLLATGDATITHKGPYKADRWTKDFPEIVMTVRDMLKEEGFVNQQENVQEQSNDPMLNYQGYVNFVTNLNQTGNPNVLTEEEYNNLKNSLPESLKSNIEYLLNC